MCDGFLTGMFGQYQIFRGRGVENRGLCCAGEREKRGKERKKK